jgi:DNA-binding MarR family transcriptional regulator
VSLIFTVRNLTHEKIVQKNNKNASFLQLITLRFIEYKKPTMKEVADYLTITAPSATSLINNLAKDELIKREEEKGDRRIVRIVITPKGERHLKKGMGSLSQKIRKNLEVLFRKEQEVLAKILGKLANNLKNNKE